MATKPIGLGAGNKLTPADDASGLSGLPAATGLTGQVPQANGGLGVDASALSNGVLVKSGGAINSTTAPTMSGANITSGSTPAAAIAPGTLHQILIAGPTSAAWTATPINLTLSGASNTFANIPAATALAGQVPVANGGTGLAAVFAVGDLLYATAAGTLGRLAAGTAGWVLTANGAGMAPSYQAPAAATVVAAKFSGTYSASTSSWANVGLSLSLTSGSWHVVFEVRNLTVVSAGAGFARLRLYDSTAGAVITDSERQGILTTGTAGGTTTITMDLDLSAPTTLDLQAARDAAATYSACQIIGDADGWTLATAFLRAA